jgi:hypothetical protein
MNRKRIRTMGPWVISVLSLFVALSSTAVALKGKNTVDSGDIKPKAVKAPDIADEAVKARNLTLGAITPFNIGVRTILSENLDDGAVTSPKLAKLSIAYGPINQLGVGDNVVESDASCPIGTRLITGGGSVSGTTAALTGSFPDAAIPGNNPKTWKVQGHLLQAATGPGFVVSYALCLGD